jgi:hypothetical protein
MQKGVYVAWFHVLSQYLATETNEKLVSMDGHRVHNGTRDPWIWRITNHSTSIIYFQTILIIYSFCPSVRFQVTASPYGASNYTPLKHTALGTTPLGKWSARRRPDNTQQPQDTDIHEPDGIRTHNPSKQAAADQRIIPRGHRSY